MRLWPGGLRARFIVAFVLAVAVVAGSTAAGLAFAARSWVYMNAQEQAISEFTEDIGRGTEYQFDLPAGFPGAFERDFTVVSIRSTGVRL